MATAAPLPPPPLHTTILTEKQLAKELPKCSVRKLRTLRSLGMGPPYLKIGREVVYLRSSVDTWLQTKELVATREQRTALTPRQSRRGR